MSKRSTAKRVQQLPGPPARQAIEVVGARQNNLRGIDVSIPLAAITAVTGVSGSGKSSLAFDTLYAEGQRRYVESFSPYARQFMDRMDRPDVERVDGVLPAVAIDQKNAIKASRSTVGTVTELTDFIKLLYAQAAVLHCAGCGEPVVSDDPSLAASRALQQAPGRRVLVTFVLSPCRTIKATSLALQWLGGEGYRRLLVDGQVVLLQDQEPRSLKGQPIEVVVDRLMLGARQRGRLVDSIEHAMTRGSGRAALHVAGDRDDYHAYRLSRGRHCAACDRSYPEPLPNHFSFNSPLGACEECNGFGAVIGLDLDLVIPDTRRSLREGAIRPWTTESTDEERRALQRICDDAGIPMDRPWCELQPQQRALVIEGDRSRRWHGIRGWFAWLERRTYKMHVRVFLSRYRAYHRCPSCNGARLQQHALLYRLAGRDLAQLYGLSIAAARCFFDELQLPPEQQARATPVLQEVRSRLRYLCDVGVDYLTLDRQSRTLSGGEVQRVNLTTAVGSGLVNTLYVLDEPSVGLHPRDNDRLIGVLQRLRANRNTIVVVEHDEAIISRCDHVIDLGPGPGEAGGQVVFAGPPAKLPQGVRQSVTARYLCGSVERRSRSQRHKPDLSGGVTIRRAREHNLQAIDVVLPKDAFTVVTGVSGSGKSTLVQDVLYRGLLRQRGRAVERPGCCDGIDGAGHFKEVVFVDQSPVGTTPRSNAATYVKAFDPIRKLFAAQPLARQRGLMPSAFSFNVAGGRCDVCEGRGFERVEMQFLSDCYITCEKCGGRRFRQEVLAVELEGKSIADVLEMTADEAAGFFAEHDDILRGLDALRTLGLGYLRLGQPLNTLSGGESQRLKLAGPLVLRAADCSLFLLDEPTTGLHLGDVQRLIENLQKLVDVGNTVVVIEHHLDVIAAADWVIDLGPEGGERGGQLVWSGPPQELVRARCGHTARYLAEHLRRDGRQARAAERAELGYLAPVDISVKGARVHNLANIDVRLPRDKLVVVTGPSGSGKSSLAFDVLFAEGQRRFVDCLSPYARQYVAQVGRPDLDELLGVPPTVAISQRTSRGGRKSTVATITEVYHFLRLVYARIGVQHCHQCGERVSGLAAEDLTKQILAYHQGQDVLVLAPAVRGRKGFHRDVIRRALAVGQTQIRVDGRLRRLDRQLELSRYREHDIDFVLGQVTVARDSSVLLRRFVKQALRDGAGTLLILDTQQAQSAKGRRRRDPARIYSQNLYCTACGIGFEPADPRLFSFNSSVGACDSCGGSGVQQATDHRRETPCPTCEGTRLNNRARSVCVGGRSIDAVTAMTPSAVAAFLRGLALSARERSIAAAALQEIIERCTFLQRLGLDYIGLDRGAHTLSGGEAQRVRLAAQLSADLRGVLYVLDEPTIGLHPVDNDRLLQSLRQLVDRGNTVVVVEHDEETIRRADHMLDLGPGGGRQGGRVVAAGTVAEVVANDASPTGRGLKGGSAQRVVYRGRACDPAAGSLRLRGATYHNLRNLSVDIPLGCLCVVTGVSGSGKSSLVHDTLADGLRQYLKGEHPSAGSIEGAERVRMVREISQEPIGKTPASTPSTYIGLQDDIRRLFAGLPEARTRGYKPGRFSFNVKGGRCEHCRGQGQVRCEMSFLPDIYVPCDACEGKRYNFETLQVAYKGLSMADVLALTVEQALEVFEAVPQLKRALQLLDDVGLDYLQLGQPSHTLSGGEAQRIKLVEELQKQGGRGTVYLMDEPSTGLHFDDLRRLLVVLQRLVDRGDTVVVIEHNLDVIGSADWIMDLGPGGGAHGGQLLFQGPRDALLERSDAQTARYLRQHLRKGT